MVLGADQDEVLCDLGGEQSGAHDQDASIAESARESLP